jgi:hypothetical protein
MSDPNAPWTVEPEPDPETAFEEKRLAEEMRRIIDRLIVVRPTAEELKRAADTARDFADRLEALPVVVGTGMIGESGLAPNDHLRHSPLAGVSNPIAPPMTLERVEQDGRTITVGSVSFGAAYVGPPGHVHGGFVAAMFDELLGRSQGSAGFTAWITTTYRLPTPLFRDLELKAWIESVDGRKRIIKGTCHLGGTLLTEAEGLFIAPREGQGLAYLNASLKAHG